MGNKFQSLTGTIHTEVDELTPAEKLSFQSLTGTIHTRYN